MISKIIARIKKDGKSNSISNFNQKRRSKIVIFEYIVDYTMKPIKNTNQNIKSEFIGSSVKGLNRYNILNFETLKNGMRIK